MPFFLFEAYQNARDRLARIPADVRGEAKRTGASIAYSDPTYGADVIIEYPNGRRERLKPDGTVIEIPKREHSHDQ